MYLRHLLAKYRSMLTADMATNSWLINQPILRVLVHMFELIDRRSTVSVDMLVDTRPAPQPICCDRQLLVYQLSTVEMYQSTVGGIRVLLTIVLLK